MSKKIAKEILSVAKSLTAETKGTITAGYIWSNGTGASFTLRKLFGTLAAKKVSRIGNKIAKVLENDINDVLAEIGEDALYAEVEIKDAMVSGFQQGGYFEVWFQVRHAEYTKVMSGLRRRGYRTK